MSEPLPRFYEDAHLVDCPKCGNEPWSGGVEHTLRWSPRLGIHPEQLVVSCGRCSYRWHYAPLDAQESE